MKLRTNPSLIPVLVASLLGLLHGLGPTLTSTLALILDKQIGPRLWCEIANVLHRHIVFSIIYCATLISVEVCVIYLLLASHDRPFLCRTPFSWNSFSWNSFLCLPIILFLVVRFLIILSNLKIICDPNLL